MVDCYPRQNDHRFLVHPDTWDDIRRACDQGRTPPLPGGKWETLSAWAGVPVQTSEFCPRWNTKWESGDPHFEYEESDRRWLSYFGFGREVEDVGNPAVFEFGRRLEKQIDRDPLQRLSELMP